MTHYAALMGIDWADTKHDICLIDLTTGEPGNFHSAPFFQDY